MCCSPRPAPRSPVCALSPRRSCPPSTSSRWRSRRCESTGEDMEQRVAIVTGGLRGLGRAMAFGLAREGHNVIAVGHIETDIAEVDAATAVSNMAGRILPLIADLRRPADCDRVVAMALQRFGGVHILVNIAGLTFTTIDPARYRRAESQKFWQVS